MHARNISCGGASLRAHHSGTEPEQRSEGTRARMKVGILTGSISGHAGGVSESVYGFARELYCPPVIDVALFGLKDSGTASYSRVWSPIPVATFSVSGPRSFGYARDLLPAIEGADIDLLHVHGLWMY